MVLDFAEDNRTEAVLLTRTEEVLAAVLAEVGRDKVFGSVQGASAASHTDFAPEVDILQKGSFGFGNIRSRCLCPLF